MKFVWDTDVSQERDGYVVRIRLGSATVYTRTYDKYTQWSTAEMARHAETELGEHLHDLVQAKINREEATPYDDRTF